jgi:imidazoleglycerol-phosphate dehydratase
MNEIQSTPLNRTPPKTAEYPDFGLLMVLDDGEVDYNPPPSPYAREHKIREQVEEAIRQRLAHRTAQVERQTAETKINLTLNLDGTGLAEVATGVGFFDHMLTLLAKHSLFDLKVQAQGDLQVDAHHTVEDVGICLGKSIAQALGDKAGIRRYGHMTLPMDEVLVTTAIDLGGRPCFVWKAEVPRGRLGNFDTELAEDFWQAVAANGLLNLHVICHYGRNTHHLIEGIFKAAARALRMAVELDLRTVGVPSTKGTLSS